MVEAAEPSFIARVWLEQIFVGIQLPTPCSGFELVGAGGASFDDSHTEAKSLNVPADVVVNAFGASPRLVLQKQGGAGRMYYSIQMKTVSRSLHVPAQSRGFTVERKVVCNTCHSVPNGI